MAAIRERGSGIADAGSRAGTDAAPAIRFPDLFAAAERISSRGQRRHARLVKADLVLLLTGAILGTTGALLTGGNQRAFAVVAAIELAAAIVVKYVAGKTRDTAEWFDGRAVAESVKTLSWRYMMRIEPFRDDVTGDGEFARELAAVGAARPNLWQDDAAPPANEDAIPAELRAVRALPVAARRDLYVRERLDDQIGWYARKADLNRRLARRWLWLAMAAQAVALALAVAQIGFEGRALTLIGLLMAVATAATAWTNIGRHGELAKNYAITGDELTAIRALAPSVRTEDDLADLVRDGEGASAREHTMWIVKRTDPLPKTLLGR